MAKCAQLQSLVTLSALTLRWNVSPQLFVVYVITAVITACSVSLQWCMHSVGALLKSRSPRLLCHPKRLLSKEVFLPHPSIK